MKTPKQPSPANKPFPSTALEMLATLREQGHLDDDQVKLASLKCQRAGDQEANPVELLERCELISRKTGKKLDGQRLTEWWAKQAGMDVVTIDPLKVDVEKVTAVMSHAFAERHGILAVEANKVGVVIAASSPDDSSWRSGLEHVVRRPIRVVLANPADIRRFQQEFYQLSRSVRGATGEQGKRFSVDNFEQLIELGKTADLDANDRHVVRIVDWLLQYAFDQRASDIHIEPRREIGKVRFRIDGMLHSIYELPGSITAAVISRFKILGRMDVADRRRPLDGRIKSKLQDGREIELRLSTIPTAFGEKLVARIFDPQVAARSFEELGLTGEHELKWRTMVKRPHGIVLVTGPTGSGKTTTLYTSLKQLARPEVNVCTIEDPIEMVEPLFNQVQVQQETGVTFASGVRALLRQDPDIIMVGEIRDRETADMAVQAALTGHLVLSTLHTNDAPSAISRLIDLGVEPFLLNATVVGVMAQRLVRTLCPSCKRAVQVDSEVWKRIDRDDRVPMPKQVFEAVGCQDCRQTGYLGRQGIYEIMVLDDDLRKLFRASVSPDDIRKEARKQGMQSLMEAGAHKVAEGQTTVEEVLRVCIS
jgi:general secretion pathway protein E